MHKKAKCLFTQNFLFLFLLYLIIIMSYDIAMLWENHLVGNACYIIKFLLGRNIKVVSDVLKYFTSKKVI